MGYDVGVHSVGSASLASNDSGSYDLFAFGGHREEGSTAYNEVPAGAGWNQWFLSGAFLDPIDPGTLRRSPSAEDVYYRIGGDQGGIGFDEEAPTSFDGDRIVDPTLEISTGIPKLPAAFDVTWVEVPLRPSSGEYKDDVGGLYAAREWEYNVSSFPESPDEHSGVRFRVHLDKDQVEVGDRHSINARSSFGYSVRSSCPGCGGPNPRTFSETDEVDLDCTFNVVE